MAEDTQDLNEPSDTAALIEQLVGEMGRMREALTECFTNRLSTLELHLESRLRESRTTWSQMLVTVTALNEHAKQTNHRLIEMNEHLDKIEEAVRGLNARQQQIELRVRALGGWRVDAFSTSTSSSAI
jgi:septal ring factor EnvC (AmiA/AmiB activator)